MYAIRRYYAKVADETSLGELVFRHMGKTVLEVVADATQGRESCILEKGGQFEVVLVGESVDHRQAEIFLAAEVMVKRSFGDARLAQYPIDTGGVIAVHGNQFGADFDNFRFFVTAFYLHAPYY